MHKDYDKNKKWKLDKQKKAYVDHAMVVFNGADNFTITSNSPTNTTAERIDDGVKLTVIQDFISFTHELMTEEITDPNKIKAK